MSNSTMKDLIPTERIERAIFLIRGQKVILDADLARLYGVTAKRLNEQVKRNRHRFPDDFAFQLTSAEFANLKSQIAISSQQPIDSRENNLNWSQFATSSSRHRGTIYRPWAFTEHGAIMAANVLNSPRAIQMSVFVVRAFVKMRGVFADTRDLARKLAALEKELKGRLDVHEAAIVTVLQRVMDILDPPPAPPRPPKPRFFFLTFPRSWCLMRYEQSAAREHGQVSLRHGKGHRAHCRGRGPCEWTG